jgi:hypothetical protein
LALLLAADRFFTGVGIEKLESSPEKVSISDSDSNSTTFVEDDEGADSAREAWIAAAI